MAKLGVKWSGIAESALPLVDLVEVNGWTLGGRLPDIPLALHNLDLDFSLSAPGAIDDTWVSRCRAMLEATGSPWISLHLGFSAEQVQFERHMMPRSSVLDRETCFRRMVDALRFVHDRLDVPLLVENLDYCPDGAYEHVCEPAFIAGIVHEVDCDLLLDLAHLEVSCDWLGLSVERYLEQLPLDRVVEVHLSSPRPIGDRLDDCHYELLDQEYELLSRLLRRCKPAAVVLEYSREERLLHQQLERLRDLLDMGGRIGDRKVASS